MGMPEDLIDAVQQGEADAVAMADILHYNRATVGDIRHVAQAAGIEVRSYEHA
jgi:cyclase